MTAPAVAQDQTNLKGPAHGFRSDIEGLRAVAVLAVIANHFNARALPGGYLGVDIFFVISGFVITGSLLRRDADRPAAALLGFYGRRIKRLVPALVLMVLTTAAAIRLFDPDPKGATFAGASALFGLSNLFFYLQAIDYFGASAQLDPFSHTWSLGVEEQFYLVFPAGLILAGAAGRRFPGAGRLFAAALAGLIVLSFALFVVAYGANPPAAYFLTPMRFWELGLGCALALGEDRVRAAIGARAPWVGGLALLTGLTGLVFAGGHPIACTALVVLATAALIAAGQGAGRIGAVLVNPPLSYLGRISYSLYLWHWPVICLSRWTLGLHAWSLPFQIAAIGLLAAGSFHLVENRLRPMRWIGGPRLTLPLGAAMMVGGLAVLMLMQARAVPPFAGSQTALEEKTAPVPGYVGRITHRRIDDCFAAVVMAGGVAGLDARAPRCIAAVPGKPLLLFVGDSHSTDLFPMAEQVYGDGVASVMNLSQDGCRAPRRRGEPGLCDYPDAVMAWLARTRPGPKILVIRNNAAPQALDGSLTDFAARLERLIDRAAALGFRVVYVAPGPKYYGVGSDSLCSRQWYRPAWALQDKCRSGFREDRAEQLARRRDFEGYLIALSRRRPGVFVFDPFDTLCGAAPGFCTPVRSGRLIYRDSSHLTEAGSQSLTRPFEAFLVAKGLAPAPRGRLANSRYFNDR
jgi:peptidoglycan/LPS O-acetylase OafA/YrhL